MSRPSQQEVEALISDLREFASEGRAKMPRGTVDLQALALPVIEMVERSADMLSNLLRDGGEGYSADRALTSAGNSKDLCPCERKGAVDPWCHAAGMCVDEPEEPKI